MCLASVDPKVWGTYVELVRAEQETFNTPSDILIPRSPMLFHIASANVYLDEFLTSVVKAAMPMQNQKNIPPG